SSSTTTLSLHDALPISYAALAQCLARVHEVIIVHPDEVLALRAVSDGIGITVIHCFVGFPKRRLEAAEILQVMKQRPDYLVGIRSEEHTSELQSPDHLV